jgi:hypothetical protein
VLPRSFQGRHGPLVPHLPPPSIDLSSSDDIEAPPARRGQLERSSPKEPNDPIQHHPQHIANRLEFEAIKMADESLRSKHMLDKGMATQAEVAQAYVLNSYARQEVQRSYQLAGQQTEAMINIARMHAADLVENGRKNAELARQLAERHGPPDQSATLLTGLKDVLVTLVGVFAARGGTFTGEPQGDSVLDGLRAKAQDAEIAQAEREIAEAKKENEALRKPKAAAEAAKASEPTEPTVQAQLGALRDELAALKAERAELATLRNSDKGQTKPEPTLGSGPHPPARSKKSARAKSTKPSLRATSKKSSSK